MISQSTATEARGSSIPDEMSHRSIIPPGGGRVEREWSITGNMPFSSKSADRCFTLPEFSQHHCRAADGFVMLYVRKQGFKTPGVIRSCFEARFISFRHLITGE